SRAGRGRVQVNGALCTVGMLESSLRGLVEITGQHEHVALLDEGTHLSLLDAYAIQLPGHASRGGPAAGSRDIFSQYGAAHAALSAALRERDDLLKAGDERARRAEYLAHQLRELQAAEPRLGEEAELERERQVLFAAEKLREAARMAEALVYGGEASAAERVGRSLRTLGEVASLDARLESALSLLRSALAEIEEAGLLLSRYAESVDSDPDRLGCVEERLEVLRGLARKHGGTLEAALAREEAMRRELASLEGGGDRLAELEGKIAEAGSRAIELAREISKARAEAARAFSCDVSRELAALAMERCRLEASFLPPESPLRHEGVALGAEGAERVRILLAPNPGEPARPLARVASGGELSRVLLAVKRALARFDPAQTHVFAEVDAGIGGGVAEAVGRLLYEVGKERQVICVTHLPQVAAFAERHLRVFKRFRGGRTATSVAVLESEEERQSEIARMLAGSTLTDSAREHARALIAAARPPVDGPLRYANAISGRDRSARGARDRVKPDRASLAR
ncbi:MAG TPA: DNA repair protein RecN, partial [Anaeromyxobacteraceae bacterium]|nr:DNA repair protein RecN [Anaeromyxobacteraceae bacterium]